MCAHISYVKISVFTNEGASALGMRQKIKVKMLFYAFYIIKYLYAVFCGT